MALSLESDLSRPDCIFFPHNLQRQVLGFYIRGLKQQG
jgi:hypothetical protein